MKLFAAFTLCLFISLSTGLSISPAAQYDPIVYQAQKALKARGYDSGISNGLWGKAIERAVKHFQVNNDLPVTGKLDEKTKTRLGIGSTAPDRRTALVMGNGDYRNISPLKNPVNDAQDVASVLKTLGFEVVHKENANQKSMEYAIVQFSKSLRKGGVGLFYYAGHGVQVNGRNYLIPIGANIDTEFNVKYEAVDMGRVLDGMYDAENGLNIVMLDACRNNPFPRSFRSVNMGLARMDAPTGTFIAYATAPGSVAADGEGRNGIFTRHLLKNMRIPGLTIEQMMKLTRSGVIRETENKQVPWQVSSLTGDFYFASGVTPKPQTSTQLSDERAKLERERQALERLKLGIERKKLEAERKRLEEEQKKNTIIASIEKKDLEIGRDDHYITVASGVVQDTKTGLEWFAGTNSMIWSSAESWANKLTIAGGGWRMPTIKELRGLYKKGLGTHNMTSLLDMKELFVWSAGKGGEPIGFENEKYMPNWMPDYKHSLCAISFNFRIGSAEIIDRFSNGWGLAVRSRR